VKRLLLSLAVTAGWCASPAAAATVSLSYEPPIPGIPPEPAYELSVAGGESASNIVLWRNKGGFMAYDKDGGALDPGEGCERLASGPVSCPTPETAEHYAVFVAAGAGDDVVDARALTGGEELTVRGGRGADTIAGTPGGDVLFGGDGRDWITGAAGDDRIQGGSGQDLLAGGPGFDLVTYKDHSRPVVVDLARGIGGPEAEPDGIGGFESVVGGQRDDHLRGDEHTNQIQGGGGDDLIEGLGAGDILSGTRVRGGGGPDRLDGRSIRCGSGRDDIVRFKYASAGPYGRSCERVLTFFFALSNRPRALAGGNYRFTAWCAAGICRSKVELHDRKGRFATGQFEIDSSDRVERSRRVRMRLDRRPVSRRFDVRVTSDEGFSYRFVSVRPAPRSAARRPSS
jgi:hypothetical protein